MTLPASWNLVTVTGSYLNRDGNPASGWVTFESQQVVKIGGQIIVPKTITAVLDGTGSISIAVPSTNDPDLSVTGWAYLVTEHIPDARSPYLIEVPYSVASIDLATVSAATSNPSTQVQTGIYATDIGVTIASQAAVATAQGAIDNHKLDLDNPHATTQAHVGLGNADNTSDADKPVSTAQQSAIDLKTSIADLASTAAGKGAALVGFKQSGTGAAVRTVLGKLLDTVHVADFGAVGDGVTDDAAAFNAAIVAVDGRGGGTIMLDAKDYGIASTVAFKTGVQMIGKGSGQYPASYAATSANFIATPKTRLLALAGCTGDMVTMVVTRGDQYAMQAVGLSGIMLDCANIASGGLRLRGVKNSHFNDLLVYRPTTTSTSYGVLIDCTQGPITGAIAQAGSASTITLAAQSAIRDSHYNGATITITAGTGSGQVRTISGYVASTKVATVSASWTAVPDATSVYSITGELAEGNGATQFNRFRNVTVWLGNTGTASGIVFEGDGVYDVNQNTYHAIKIIHADGPGLRFYNGDFDSFYEASTFAFGNGYGCEMYGSDTANYNGFCRGQYFNSPIFSGAGVGFETGTALAGTGQTISLAASVSATDNYYLNKFIDITGGTGIGQRRKIINYVGLAKKAAVAAWTTIPDNTSTYSINGGGGVAMFKGAWAASRGHNFSAGRSGVSGGSGSGIWAEDGASYIESSTDESDYWNVSGGYKLSLGGGTGTQIIFKGTALNKPIELASIRTLVTGTEGANNGELQVFTRKLGAEPTVALSIGDGIRLNNGSLWKKLLQVAASLNFPSVAAQSSQSLTVTLTGAEEADIVMLGLPSAGVSPSLAFKGHVSATNTVTVTAMNYTAVAVDPGNLSFRVAVMGF